MEDGGREKEMEGKKRRGGEGSKESPLHPGSAAATFFLFVFRTLYTSTSQTFQLNYANV